MELLNELMAMAAKEASRTCEVCYGESGGEFAGVFGSILLPASFACCRTCLDNDAEPYALITDEVLDRVGHYAPWVNLINTWKDGRYVPVTELLSGA